ncbi:MAG TPA: helix-turn-helix domain-containing protein [Acidimicrobiales bacterium]|nr:helix-turn-helix domain-containing protein [Acidimicrobiales bacterium]
MCADWAAVPEWLADVATARAVVLFFFLRRYANDSSREAWPSRRTLALRMRVSGDTVDRLLKELVALDAITIEHRLDEAGDPTTNRYTITPQAWRPSLGSRTGAATPGHGSGHGGRVDAATGSRTGAAQNESQRNESQERERGAHVSIGQAFSRLVRRRPGEASDLAASYVDQHGEDCVRAALERLRGRQFDWTSSFQAALDRELATSSTGDGLDSCPKCTNGWILDAVTRDPLTRCECVQRRRSA